MLRGKWQNIRLGDDTRSLYLDIGLIQSKRSTTPLRVRGKQSDLKVSKRLEETSTKRGDMNDR